MRIFEWLFKKEEEDMRIIEWQPQQHSKVPSKSILQSPALCPSPPVSALASNLQPFALTPTAFDFPRYPLKKTNKTPPDLAKTKKDPVVATFFQL